MALQVGKKVTPNDSRTAHESRIPLRFSEVRSDLHAKRRIDSDLACARCAYNLRTLSVDASCPECGLPNCQSFAPAGFQFGTVSAVRGALRGVGLLLLAELSIGILHILQFLWLRYDSIVTILPLRWFGWVMLIQGTIATLLRCLGVFLVVRERLNNPSHAPSILRWVCLAFTGTGLLARVFVLLSRFGVTPASIFDETIAQVCDTLVFLASFSAFLILIIALQKASYPFLWWLMTATVAPWMLLFLPTFLRFAHWLESGQSGRTIVFAKGSLASWFWNEWMFWYDQDVNFGLRVLTLVGLGLFARTLSAASPGREAVE